MEAIRNHNRTHRTMNNIANYLADNWGIGIFAGVVAYIMSGVEFFLSDGAIQLAGKLGVWAALFVAVLTGIMKFIDFCEWCSKKYNGFKSKRRVKRK